MKIVKSLEEKTIQIKAKEQKNWISTMLLGTLSTRLMGSLLTSKVMKQ